MKSALNSAKRSSKGPKHTKGAEASSEAPTPVTAEALRAGITPAIVAKIKAEASAAAKGKKPSDLPVPIAAYMAEALGLAATIAKYWHSSDPKKVPSLSRFAHKLPESTSAEILHLVDLLQGSRDKARALVAVADPEVLARAKHLYRELRVAAEFDADDGVEDAKDQELAALKKAHETEPDSIAELADALASFAAHASTYRSSFATIPDFDMAMLDEAARLVDTLRLRKTNTDATAGMAAKVRDVYLALLDQRIANARKVFRYAFRATPEIVREATSAYERERRRAARKPDASEGDEPIAPEDTSGDDVTDDDA
ncbi:MAG: hypothetical protein IPK71_08025 [Myxococcales bacterium]|jgi:hypothetical protein|nr:hypothetical protein [Myxococcales bacterium]